MNENKDVQTNTGPDNGQGESEIPAPLQGVQTSMDNIPKEGVEKNISPIPDDFYFKGINDVLDERLRQIIEEGYGSSGDDMYDGGTLAIAGCCYAMHAAWSLSPINVGKLLMGVPELWPWDPSTWNPQEIRRNLIKGAALLIAEIDRIDRAEQNKIKLSPSEKINEGVEEGSNEKINEGS